MMEANGSSLALFLSLQVLALALQVARGTNTSPMMMAFTLLRSSMVGQHSKMEGYKLEIKLSE